MFTLCPKCQTIFRLTPRHLAAAGGRTRCGECRRVYNALDSLYEDLSSTRKARDTAQRSAVVSPGRDAAGNPALPPLPPTPGAGFNRGLGLRKVFGAIIIVFMVLLMAAQWVFFNRAELAREAGWRAPLEQFCGYLGCSLPLQVDLSQLELINRDIRQHPRVDEALLVNATLSNTADFTQPYPVLEINFSDLGGNPVAVRRFRPMEYIHDAFVIDRGMPPGEPIPIVLEIRDPGENAVSFQFGFL